jgi:hypothetical protein
VVAYRGRQNWLYARRRQKQAEKKILKMTKQSQNVIESKGK